MCWDAANNLIVCSSGQGLVRAFSLGTTETCITTNDITGTNGGFTVILPPTTATVAATTPTASQGGGTPTAGVFTISLNQSVLTVPVTVSFTLSGTASYLTNYLIANPGTDGNGVIVNSNKTTLSVTFPAATSPSGNWSKDIQILPTPTPVTGPTLTAVLKVLGGGNNLAGTPNVATVNILNTGPQLLVLSALTTSSTMSRSVAGDYATFVITRYGDLSAGAYTLTNFTYLGTASYPGDYTANAQKFTGTLLSAGAPGITINPGDVTITNAIGNPVAHNNLSLIRTNVTIVLSLTNGLTGTNCTALEGITYGVSTNAVTLTELDNTFGPEVVLWSNPLTNSLDSTNWTLTYAATNLASSTTLPVVVPNYTNGQTALVAGGTNDFNVNFGYAVAADGITPSPAMTANGWANVLKMTVNKDGGATPTGPTGVNLYPQGKIFAGNYALRFSMYLSIYDAAINNAFAGTLPREFAAFGINHKGTNCNWRLASPISATAGNSTTNSDGIWFAIDAGDNSVTPADFDAFLPATLPNSGVTTDIVSDNGRNKSGIFKNPPFTTVLPSGGQPVDQWVDVSVELTRATNCSLFMNGSQVLTSFSTGTNYTSGTVMLGYLDPVADRASGSAFVYYSNIRVVELSPYITSQPVSLMITNGANVSLASSAAFATAPLTGVWWYADASSAPTLSVLTNIVAATNMNFTLPLTSYGFGTNFVAVFSDAAGSITSSVVSLEVISGPASKTVNAGSNFVSFAVTASGPSAPTSYQWKTNGVNLVNGTHFAGVTTATLTLTNAQLLDAVTYTCTVVNPAGSVSPAATLTVIAPPPAFASVAVVTTNAVLNFTTPNLFDNTGSFTLQSSGNVAGPYTNTPGTVTGSAGTFQFKVPYTTNSAMFYRLKHN